MAVNYGSGATEAPDIRNAVTPKDGVQDKSGLVLLQGVTGLFEQAGAILEDKKQSKNDAIIADFASKQLLIAEGLEQGTISSSAYARSLARKNLLEAINANPALAKELIAADGSLISLPGGTGEVRDGTEEEKRVEARKTQLVTAGIMPADASDDEFQTYDEMARTAEEAERRHKERMDTIDLQLKSNALATSEREKLEAERTAEVTRYVQDTAPVAHQMVKTKFEEILKDPELSEADKVVAIEEYYNQWLAETSGTLGELESQQASYMLKPFEELKNIYVQKATGELGDAEVERRTKRNLELQKSLALADPVIARMAVASELFGDSAFINALTEGTKPQNDALLRFLNGNSPSVIGADPVSSFTSLPDEKKALKSYLNVVTLGLNSPDPAVKAESEGNIRNILKGLEDYEGLIRSDPTKAIEIVNWIGSSAFIAARNANPDLFADTSGAVDVLTRHYADEVWGMVEREFLTNNVIIPGTLQTDPIYGKGITVGSDVIPATEGIGVKTTDSGMEFYSIDPNADKAMLDEVRRLNKELKPVINSTVHAFAHLDGRTDYGKVWEEGAFEFLGGDPGGSPEEKSASGGDTGDNLSAEDFARYTGLTANYEPLVALVDKTEGGGDYDTLLGYNNKEGMSFEGVKVSEMTIGEALDFAAGGGDYAELSKDLVGRMATPMGRYQIVGRTLKDTAEKMGLSLDTPFNAETQDAMFAFLAQQALATASTLKGKRAALRGVWEGFKNASNEELDAAIANFEGDE